MGLPKKKTTKMKRDLRRANHALVVIQPSKCSQCGELKAPHRVCACGFYKGKEIFTPKSAR